MAILMIYMRSGQVLRINCRRGAAERCIALATEMLPGTTTPRWEWLTLDPSPGSPPGTEGTVRIRIADVSALGLDAAC